MSHLIINRKNIVVNILKFNSNIWVIDIHKPKQPTQRIWNNTKNGKDFYSFDFNTFSCCFSTDCKNLLVS